MARHDRPDGTAVAIAALWCSILVVPAVVLAETEFDLLSASGPLGLYALGAVAMLRGILLGGGSLLVMLGPE